MYMSPPWNVGNPDEGVFSVLVADTMVTSKGHPGEPMLPIRGLTRQGTYSTILRRKLNIAEKCAVALPGPGDATEQVIRRVRAEIDDWAKLDRPMKPFADYMSSLNDEHYRQPTVYGTAVIRGRDGNADDLLTHLREADMLMNRWDPTDVDAIVKANAFVNLLNGRKLAQEMVLGSQRSWGGFMEWAYLLDKSWEFGPSVLHCFLLNGACEWPPELSDRFLAYDPHIGTGALMSLASSELSLFALKPILDDPAYRGEISSLDWAGWKPDFVTINVLLDPNNPEAMYNKTLNHDEMDYVTFTATERGVHVSSKFPENYLEGLISQGRERGTIIAAT